MSWISYCPRLCFALRWCIHGARMSFEEGLDLLRNLDEAEAGAVWHVVKRRALILARHGDGEWWGDEARLAGLMMKPKVGVVMFDLVMTLPSYYGISARISSVKFTGIYIYQ